MRGLWMAGIALALVAAGGGTAGAATMASEAPGSEAPGHEAPVAMSVRAVGQVRGQSVVLLEDAGGARRLPIWIGDLEAGAIDMRVKKVKAQRPLTHDLLEASLAALGAKVERVDVTALRDGVFYGRLTLKDARGGLRVIDARPSDCIALAVGAGLPVWVAPSVLRAAASDAP